MFEFLNLKAESFGLDISDLSLKIVRLRKKRGGFALASFGEQRIKLGAVKDGEVKDEDALAESIKEGISKIRGEKIRTEYVVCSLPEEQGFLQVIQMPKLGREELKKAVRYEAENYIPLPINEVYLDSQVIPPVYNHLDHSDILVVAFPQKIVDPYISALKKAELQPKVLELESLSIARALVKKEVVPYTLLLIDLGFSRTGFIFFSGYSIRFTSSIPTSSQEFTEAIAQKLGVNRGRAEQLKLKYGIEGKRTKGKEILEILNPALTKFVEQTKKHLDFYQSHNVHEHLPPGEEGVRKILLCGGGASLKGLPGFLSDQLKIPVEVANPWVNILSKPEKGAVKLPLGLSLGYTTALGLALRGAREIHD